MKKHLFIDISLLLMCLVIFSSCFMLKRYIYTDKELEAHYENKSIKPSYRTQFFLNHQVHYAVLSKNDTLPLLIMIHGAPGAWYGYMNLADDSLLQTNFKIVAVDRLGYGKSDYGKEELSTQMQALAIKAIIEKENRSKRKMSLLGRSYGAPIAAWLAINYPQKFEKLLMVSPVIDPDKEKFYWFSGLGNTQVVQWMLPGLLNVATKEKFSHPSEMKKMLPKWSKLYIPTYVLVGSDDQVADTANFTFAKKHLLNCQAVFMKLRNTGHLVTYQQPELVKRLLLENGDAALSGIMKHYSTEAEITFNNITILSQTALRAEKVIKPVGSMKPEDLRVNKKQ